ncbi:MFS transporter [Aestuariirhabdus sp. Z083]|nr:MFS transporter [Aestuariirhabdus haliotis]
MLVVPRFFISCFLAFIGGHVMNYSVIFYAQEVLQSDLLAGLGFFLSFGAAPLLVGWYAGALCDRASPTLLVVLSQLLFVIGASLLLVLVSQDLPSFLSVGVFLGAATCSGIAWCFIAPARLALLGRLVALKDLHRASVLFNVLVMLGFGVAPIMIALLRQEYGWHGPIGLILLLFFAASLLLVGVRVERPVIPAASILSDVRNGFSYVAKHLLIRQLLLVTLIVYSVMGPVQVILPRFAIDSLGLTAMDRGLLLAIMALALFVGGVICMTLGQRLPQGKAIIGSLLISSLLMVGLGCSQSMLEAAVWLFFAGMLAGVSVSLIVAALQLNSQDQFRGRVMSFYTISTQVLPATSGFLCGLLLEWVSPAQGLVVAACVLIVLGAIALWRMTVMRSYG